MSQNVASKILSDITVYMKYARYIPKEQRRETWEEIVDRNMNMHISKYPHIEEEIKNAFQFIRDKKVLPSMRSMQFAGKPIEISPNRIYNCAYLPVDDVRAFSEAMFLLLGGTGVGYSVQHHHVNKLPLLRGPLKPADRRYRPKRFLIGDSIEGWADTIKTLMNSYFEGTREVEFDYRDIRPKGSKLVTSGGKAPGPQPLKDCVHNIRKVLNTALEERGPNTRLKPIEVHDIMCHIADAVLAGGIRRAAMISLFSFDDEEMRTSKFGNWWEMNPQRGRANNSAVAVRHKIEEEDFFDLWDKIKASGSGEPGIYFTNDKEWGTNPCYVGDTIVATADGRNGVAIRNLAYESAGSKKFPVYSAKEVNYANQFGQTQKFSHWKTEIKNAVAFKTGTKEVIEIILSDGSSFKCTPEHKLATKDGRYVEAQYSEGEELAKFYTFSNKNSSKSYRHINSTSNGHSRQYRMIYEFYNGELSSEDTIDHIDQDTTNDSVTNLQALSLEGHNKKSGESKLEKENPVHRVKNKAHHKWALRKAIIRTNGERYGWPESKIKKFEKEFLKNNPEPQIEDENIALNHRIFVEEVVWNGEIEDVFDLTVEDNHNFYVITKTDDEKYLNCSGYLTHNCVEIGLRPNQFCNLTTINGSNLESQEDLNQRARAAAFIGTLQAGYTDFHYLRDVWRETTEKEALIGVSMTGVASGDVLNLDMTEAANQVKKENAKVAKWIGINKAARTTAVKPEGCLTKDSIVSTSEGILSLDEIGETDGAEWQDHQIEVNTDTGKRKSTRFYVNGYKPTKKIVLDSGIEIESTYNHKFRVLTEDGDYVWRKAEELGEGDMLPYSVGEYDGGEYQQLNKVEFNHSPHATRTKSIEQPEYLNEDLAWLLGLYFGDGTNKDRSIRIYGNSEEQKGFDKATRIFKEQFGLDVILKERVSDNPNEKRCHLQINSKELLNFLAANDISKNKSYEIDIPKIIRMSPKSVIQAFIDGYQTADGCDKGNNISFSTVSEKFARQLVVVLRAIGHDAKLRRVKRKDLNSDTKHKGNRDSYWVTIRKGRNQSDWGPIKKLWKDAWHKLDNLGFSNLSVDIVQDVYDSNNYTYDLEIDHEDHTYLANSYVSHNTSSLVLGTSSGIHAWHNDYYLRRIRVGKDEPIYQYLSIMHPELIEDEYFRPDSQAVITVPQAAPEGAILRHESASELLDRVKKVSKEWVHPGHRKGSNRHNVSVTVSVKDDEWDTVGKWMWENRDIYNGISVLPHDGGTYTQAPFEDTTKKDFEKRFSQLSEVDLSKIVEVDDNTDLSGEIACGGGSCEVTSSVD